MANIKRLITGIVLIALVAIAPLKLGVAQTQEGGSGLQITPTRTEMSLLPGEQKEFEITVKNVTQGPVDVKSAFNDFESDGVTGEPQIVVDPNREIGNSMKDYVKGLEDFSLKKDESKNVKLTVDFPAESSPGGYYGVVRFQAVPQGQGEGETQVSLNASVASLLLVEVSGDIKEQIQIDSINSCNLSDDQLKEAATKCENSKSLFFATNPTAASIKIANQGNSFTRPFGRVTVNRGSSEVYAYELNNKEPRGVILPGSTRIFTDKIENVNKFGKYTITANISHGQGGEVITKSASFWYIPVWALLVIAAVIVSIIALGTFIFVKLGKKRKSKK
jgi:hypothetical protein